MKTSFARIIPVVSVVERHHYRAVIDASTWTEPVPGAQGGVVTVRVPFHPVVHDERPASDAVDGFPRGAGPDAAERAALDPGWRRAWRRLRSLREAASRVREGVPAPAPATALEPSGRLHVGTLRLDTRSAAPLGRANPARRIGSELAALVRDDLDREAGGPPRPESAGSPPPERGGRGGVGIPIVVPAPGPEAIRRGTTQAMQRWSYGFEPLDPDLLDVRCDARLRSAGLLEPAGHEIVEITVRVQRRKSATDPDGVACGWRIRSARLDVPDPLADLGADPELEGTDGTIHAAGPRDPDRAVRIWDAIDVPAERSAGPNADEDASASEGAEVTLRIPLPLPGPTARADRCTGSIVLEATALRGQCLSGLAPDLFDAAGRQVLARPGEARRNRNDVARTRSLVQIDLRVMFDALAASRQFPVRRTLLIDGVRPSREVLDDVLRAARSVGLQINGDDLGWRWVDGSAGQRAATGLSPGSADRPRHAGVPDDDIVSSVPAGAWIDIDGSLECLAAGQGADAGSIRIRLERVESSRGSSGGLSAASPGSGGPAVAGDPNAASAAPAATATSDGPGRGGRVRIMVSMEHGDPAAVQRLIGRLDRRLRERLGD